MQTCTTVLTTVLSTHFLLPTAQAGQQQQQQAQQQQLAQQQQPGGGSGIGVSNAAALKRLVDYTDGPGYLLLPEYYLLPRSTTCCLLLT